MERTLDLYFSFSFSLSLWHLNTSTAFLILSFLCRHFAIYIYIVCVCVCVCIYYKYILYLSTDRCIHYYKKRASCYTNFTFTFYIYIYIYIKNSPPTTFGTKNKSISVDSNFLPRWTQHQINAGGIKLSASDVDFVPALC